MRRYHQPAEVELDGQGFPARFRAWGRTYVVVEEAEPYWEEMLPWWEGENAGKSVEELRVRHFHVRAHGRQRSAVVELVQRGGMWFVEGVED
ncbi:hypothetical protein Pth03_78140 [Planotetraspora thailandica]|uniref:Uncharacterized protein n=1 Tax=Planotetraspora thailandica TaxID=487172 RepID=A0A8J3Y2B3_9ACTN|nr:hypothetical protein [Planotetraspora thailandica]GII59425.1 hypothetical protein Pth03_78140 [Planotetraspora thailandica]